MRAVFAVAELAAEFVVRDFFGATEGSVLYRTLSVCPCCLLVDQRGLAWVPATVEEVRRGCV